MRPRPSAMAPGRLPSSRRTRLGKRPKPSQNRFRSWTPAPGRLRSSRRPPTGTLFSRSRMYWQKRFRSWRPAPRRLRSSRPAPRSLPPQTTSPGGSMTRRSSRSSPGRPPPSVSLATTAPLSRPRLARARPSGRSENVVLPPARPESRYRPRCRKPSRLVPRKT